MKVSISELVAFEPVTDKAFPYGKKHMTKLIEESAKNSDAYWIIIDRLKEKQSEIRPVILQSTPQNINDN
jgi:hypothetical protein